VTTSTDFRSFSLVRGLNNVTNDLARAEGTVKD
jgi:hypothetical protein